MQGRFFLPGIAPDVARIAHAFAVRFLEPLVQFILVLVEPITAKDISFFDNGVEQSIRNFAPDLSAAKIVLKLSE